MITVMPEVTLADDDASNIGAMPDRAPSPTVRRHRVSAELKRLREEAGFTDAQAAAIAECSTDKIHWIERGQWVRPPILVVKVLLKAYGNVSEDQQEELIEQVREAAKPDWWHPYRKMISRRYSNYIGLEAEAVTLLSWQPLMVHGLLQTDDYARAIIQAGPYEITADEVESRVTLRAERQHRILTAEGAKGRLHAVIDEGALLRPVGGPEVMRAQLARLAELAGMPKVTLQLIPLDAGAHPGTGGAFTIISTTGYPDVAYVETIAGELLLQAAEDVDRYQVAIRKLIAMALPSDDTIRKIADTASA